MTEQELDVAAMRMQLSELKFAFDNAMTNGEVFENTKKTYMTIKELELRLNVVESQSLRNGRMNGQYDYPPQSFSL